jgi:response regulator RpfG family c-di-GMP phosphodiesterase
VLWRYDIVSSENCVTISTCPRDNRGPKSFETVLVLSGDSLVRAAIVQLLRDCGYRVVEAESTDRAIGIMRHRDILVDVVMSEIVIRGSVNGFIREMGSLSSA